jgi:hypothetical protein
LEFAEKKLPYEATYIEEGENKPEWYELFLSQTIAPQKVPFVLVSVIHQKIVKLSASSALVINLENIGVSSKKSLVEQNMVTRVWLLFFSWFSYND